MARPLADLMAFERELDGLLNSPGFEQAVAQHAQASGEQHPVERVRKGVFGALNGHPRAADLANAAADHAHAHLQSLHKKVAEDESKKVSKVSVSYRPGSVPQHCGNCSMYRDHACTLVRGVIDPSFVCKKWEAQGRFKAHASILAHAKQAPDGHHYVPDPTRPGKFARVVGSPHVGGQQEPAMISQGSPSLGSNMRPDQQGNIRTIDFYRHGSTDLNGESGGSSEDRIRGHKDVPLNQQGREQAAQTGDAMRADPPDALVSSDLGRSRETAQILSQRSGVPVAWVSEHFRPWDAGQLTGQPSKKAVPVMAKYAEQAPDKPLPQGESFHSFLGRFFIGLHHALAANPGKRLGVVAHHRNERALHSWAAKGYPPDGSIDHKVFAQKGERTGAAQKIQIPMDRLAAVAQRWQQAAASNQPDRPEDERPGQE